MAKVILPKNTYQNQGMYEFRKKITLNSAENAKIKIFASSRYILYINGEYVCEGPCRSSEDIRYYDTVTSDSLKKGENEICVKVIHLTDKTQFTSVFKTFTPMLIAKIKTDSETISTDSSWECLFLKNHKLIYSEWTFIPPYEEIFDTEGEILELSESKDYDFNKSFISPYGTVDYFIFLPRPIPMISPGENVTLTPVKKGSNFIEFDAGCYMTAKLSFDIAKNNDIKIIYSECYETENGKIQRDDTAGFLKGQYDIIHAQKEDFTFNTYWFRAFRYIRIETENPDIAIKSITAKKCHYPLDITGTFECSDESYNKMHEISINTMLCCTHEIFVDCPHYEQQQYIMDSAIEASILMRMSADTKMVKKCISEFAASQHPSGLLSANYPCSMFQVIPGFSFFWVFLLKDYLEYSKDTEFTKTFTGTIDKIFTYFENNLNKDGLISRSEYWDFADWVPEWYAGIPNVGEGEVLTIYNLYYAAALKSAEYICRKTGREYLADEYSRRHTFIKEKITELCFNKEKNLFQDGSKTEEFSMHTIIWAILAEIVTGDSAKQMAAHLFDKDISVSSFSMNYYLFRALEKCGCYNYAFNFFKGWQDMIDMHCTTWCENPDSPRSECHGWSSAPLYEFSANILGVKYSFDDALTISPVLGNLTYAKGSVPTRFGSLNISWKIEENTFTIKVISPKNIEKKIILPNGEVKYTKEETSEFSCEI